MDFLKEVPLPVLQTAYRMMQVISFPVVAVFGAGYAKKYGLSRWKGGAYSLAVYVMLFSIMYILPRLMVLIGLSDSINSSRCFLFVLIPTSLYSRWFGISALQGCDFVAPGLYIARAIGKIGCVLIGCCHGVECSWGMYSPMANAYVFPLHFIESISCVVIAVVILIYINRKRYQANGKAYAISMVMLGAVRYLGQFTTDQIFNEQSVYAIAMVLLGLTLIYLVDQKKPRSL